MLKCHLSARTKAAVTIGRLRCSGEHASNIGAIVVISPEIYNGSPHSPYPVLRNQPLRLKHGPQHPVQDQGIATLWQDTVRKGGFSERLLDRRCGFSGNRDAQRLSVCPESS